MVTDRRDLLPPEAEAHLPALISEYEQINYGQLRQRVDEMATRLHSLPQGIAALLFKTDIESIVFYLAAWVTNRQLILLDPKTKVRDSRWLFERFDPAICFGFDETIVGYTSEGNIAYHVPRYLPQSPAICLTTSGSTGSPKLVKLDPRAVTRNAHSIAQCLQLTPAERAVTSLPLSYSYGLSVINSHLYSGSSIVLTDSSILDRKFWQEFRTHNCTSFAGVPYSYELLRRIRFDASQFERLRYMTQAGGRLSQDLKQYFHRMLDSCDKRFLVMYGQTEATARMSVLQHEDFLQHPESVGKAIPDGHFQILDHEDRIVERGREGRIIYSGPNVMQGYVESVEEFDQSSISNHELDTGDIGFLDENDFLYVTGRSKRIGKIHGTRINLDDVEKLLQTSGTKVATISLNDKLVLIFEGGYPIPVTSKQVAQMFKLNSSVVDIHSMEKIPMTPNGKINYSSLMDRYLSTD